MRLTLQELILLACLFAREHPLWNAELEKPLAALTKKLLALVEIGADRGPVKFFVQKPLIVPAPCRCI